jgi:hypothetical protein
VTAEQAENAALPTRGRILGPRGESSWPAALMVVAAILLQLLLPPRLVPGARGLLPVIQAVLLIPVFLGTRYRHHKEPPRTHFLTILIIGLVNIANIYSLVLLVYYLVRGGKAEGHELILASIDIWFTNVIIFGLWFWELDRGGPGARTAPDPDPPEFLFPQMQMKDAGGQDWRPVLFDYVYVSLTNASAFSPTDTMPLSIQAKALMGLQAMISLLTVILVAARAVNILS